MKTVPLGIAGLAILASGLFAVLTTTRAQPGAADSDDEGLLGPVVTITFADNTTVTTSAEAGLSELVELDANEAVGVLLQFPLSLVGQRVLVQSPDGAVASSDSDERIVHDDGTVFFGFQIGSASGQYRITAEAGGTISTIRLWVADPNDSSMKPDYLIRRKHKNH